MISNLFTVDLSLKLNIHEKVYVNYSLINESNSLTTPQELVYL